MLFRAGMSAVIVGAIFVVSPARRGDIPLPTMTDIGGAAARSPDAIKANLASGILGQVANSSAASHLLRETLGSAPMTAEVLQTASSARPTAARTGTLRPAIDSLRPADRRASWRGPTDD